MTRENASYVAVGQVVDGKYKVLAGLGRGGMGEVFVAQDLKRRDTVAIKVLSSRGSEKDVARFVQEARVMLRLRSEHVARVLDVGTLDSGRPYIVMEHLRGQDFARLLETFGAFSVEEAVTSIVQVAKAIAEAHKAGVVHRDLKPSNLFLTQRHAGRWFVKVLDFGISKMSEESGGENLTGTAEVFGTPGYMSPEQTRSAKLVDGRTDVWSLGLILAECLSGVPVYQGATQLGIMAAVTSDAPPNLHLEGTGTPPELEKIIRRCLEKNPADRYQDVEELTEALLQLSERPSDVTTVATSNANRATAFHDATTKTHRSGRRFSMMRERPQRLAILGAASLVVLLGITSLARSGKSDASTSEVAMNAARPAQHTAVDRAGGAIDRDRADPVDEVSAIDSTAAPAPDDVGNVETAAPSARSAARADETRRATRSRVPRDGLHDRK